MIFPSEKSIFVVGVFDPRNIVESCQADSKNTTSSRTASIVKQAMTHWTNTAQFVHKWQKPPIPGLFARTNLLIHGEGSHQSSRLHSQQVKTVRSLINNALWMEKGTSGGIYETHVSFRIKRLSLPPSFVLAVVTIEILRRKLGR